MNAIRFITNRFIRKIRCQFILRQFLPRPALLRQVLSCQALSRQVLLFMALLLSGIHAANAVTGGKYFPNLPLVNQDGETVYFYDDLIKDKVVSINFMFTSCGDSCPLETAKLRKVQKLLGDHLDKNVFMYSISVDPDRDTPAVLKAYMKKFDVGPGWQFLTGKKEHVDQIRKKLGVYAEGETELSDHQITFMLGNEATGQWLKRTPFDLPQAIVATLLGRLQKKSLAQLSAYSTTGQQLAAARTGEDLFNSRCATCHSIGQTIGQGLDHNNDRGDKLGPDLLGVVAKRERIWLVRWLFEPDVMLQEKDPLAIALYNQYNKVPMPNLQLESKQIAELIDYMQSETRRQQANTNAASTSVTSTSVTSTNAASANTSATSADAISNSSNNPTSTRQ